MATQDIEIMTSGTATDQAQAACGCGCCGDAGPVEQAAAVQQAAPVQAGAGSTTTSYAIAGMTCGHCVGAVTQELRGLAGVDAVDVTLVAGGTSTVTVTSSGEVSDEAVAAAVDEAGYTVVTG